MFTSFFKILSMMVGEIGYNDLLYRTHWIIKETDGTNNTYLDTGRIPQIFPATTLILVNAFIFIFPVIVMNLFFGIAVNEVNSIFKFGIIHQRIKMVKIIQIYEKYLDLTPSSLHKFITLKPLYKEVGANVCEVDLYSHGREKSNISRHLEKRILMAIERTQYKGQKLPTLLDIMKLVELNKAMIEKLMKHILEKNIDQ